MDEISPMDRLATSLSAVVEITKAMRDLSDVNLIQTKFFELTREIMSAQACALEVQSAQVDLQQSKRDLEEEIAKLKAWTTEKYRYELQSVGPGAFAYVVKSTMCGNEPIHWICADCFQNGKKRFLNESHYDLRFVYYKCQECSGKIRIRKTPSPPTQAMGGADHDLFGVGVRDNEAEAQ